MKVSFYIAKRYIIAKSSQNVINIINRMSLFVLIMGGASLMIVLAGFAGLKAFSLSFSNFFDPDLKILPKTGKFITISDNKLKKINQIKEINAFSKVVEERVFLVHNEKNFIAHIKGIDTSYPSVNQMDSILVIHPDTLFLGENSVIVGDGIARKLNLGLYNAENPLQIIVPKAGKGSITNEVNPYREVLVVASDYYRVTEDLDQKYVFSTLQLAQNLLGISQNEISAIELKINGKSSEKIVKEKLATIFGSDISVKNRAEINEDLHRMFNTENLATYLIFTLVLIIALFNLVGAIIMMILDKRKDLKTLFALGLPFTEIKRIFFLQGVLISLIGSLLGVLLGICVAFIQIKFQVLLINPDSLFPIPYPMEIRWKDIFLVFFTILLLGIFASWIGANRVKSNFILPEK